MTLRISPMVVLRPLPPTMSGSSDSTTSASVPSSERSLPRMISLLSTVWTSASYSAPVGSVSGKHRRRQPAFLRRLAGREQRNEAAHAVDQLQIGDEVAELLDRLPRHQVLAFDHDQHVELAGREALGHLLVLPELRRVGAEQLAQRIVDLETAQAEGCEYAHQRENDGRYNRGAQRNQAQPLDAIGEVVKLPRRCSRGSVGRPYLVGIAGGHGISFGQVPARMLRVETI